MQPHHFAIACLCLCQYTKKLLWGNLVFQLSSLFLVFPYGTCKEARMETRLPPITSQIRDTTRVARKKHEYWSETRIKSVNTCEWSKTSVKFELSCTRGNNIVICWSVLKTWPLGCWHQNQWLQVLIPIFLFKKVRPKILSSTISTYSVKILISIYWASKDVNKLLTLCWQSFTSKSFTY